MIQHSKIFTSSKCYWFLLYIFIAIKDTLVHKYQDTEWCELQIIPEENSLTTPLSEEMMTPVFDAWQIKAEAIKGQGQIRHKRNVSEKDYAVVRPKCLQDLLSQITVIRDTDLNDLQPNFVQLVGIAGTGKTTAVRQLAWLWANEKFKYMNKYELVFYLPVRDKVKEGLMDTLCDQGLLPEFEKVEFYHWLQISENAGKVLFIVDGADENAIPTGKDLYNLVTGRLFSGATVLVTARPEAECLSTFDRKPRAKLSLLGTDKASVDRMIGKTVEGMCSDDIAKFKQRYEEKLSDLSLLLIPLYLTLLCIVFKDDLTEGLECTSLKIPESMTMLFNSFIHVLIKRWLKRRKHENIRISCDNGPLDLESNVPSHIKQSLYFIGRICYRGLLRNQYEFSEQDARNSFLDMDVIKDSGLFTVGRSKEGEIFFTKHKQLQEYLASVYLASEGVEESLFAKVIFSEVNKNRPLVYVMRYSNLIKVIEFTCGLSAEFLRYILTMATTRFSVMKSYLGQIDIYYEAALFTEQHARKLPCTNGDKLEGFNELKEYLFKSGINTLSPSQYDILKLQIPSQSYNPETHGFYQTCLKKLTSLFHKDFSIQLLSHFYGMTLIPVTSKQCTDYLIYSGNAATPLSTVQLSLDQLQTELLKDVSIQSVWFVSVKGNYIYVDITGLLKVFPNLSMLSLEDTTYIPYLSCTRSLMNSSTGLTSVSIENKYSSRTLPELHVLSLSQQPDLTHLSLHNISILKAYANKFGHQAPWTHLQSLKMMELTLYFDVTAVTALRHLMQSNRNTLKECELNITVAKFACVFQIEWGLKTLQNLQNFGLKIACLRSWRSEKQSVDYDYTDEAIKAVLPHLKHLQTLKIWYENQKHLFTNLVDVASQHVGLKTLKIVDYSTALPEDSLNRLAKKGIDVIKLKPTFWDI